MIQPLRLRPSPSLGRPSAVLVEEPADWTVIQDPGVNLCWYRRTVPSELEQFAATCLVPLELKRSVRCDSRRPNLDELFQGIPVGAGFRLFHDDVLFQID